MPKNPHDKDLNSAMRKYVAQIPDISERTLHDREMTYEAFFEDKMLVVQAIRSGLTFEMFNEICSVSPFSEADWAEYLNVSTKTMQRIKKEKNFTLKPIHTEKIFELAEVTQRGEAIFGSSRQFYQWLKTPCKALGNLTPADLLRDSYGKEMVMAELNRIDQGIFA